MNELSGVVVASLAGAVQEEDERIFLARFDLRGFEHAVEKFLAVVREGFFVVQLLTSRPEEAGHAQDTQQDAKTSHG